MLKFILKPSHSRHHWDQINCPDFSGEFILQSTGVLREVTITHVYIT